MHNLVRDLPGFVNSKVRLFVSKLHNFNDETMSEIEQLPENQSFTRTTHEAESIVTSHYLKWRELFRPQVNFEGFMQQKLYKIYDFVSAVEARC